MSKGCNFVPIWATCFQLVQASNKLNRILNWTEFYNSVQFVVENRLLKLVRSYNLSYNIFTMLYKLCSNVQSCKILYKPIKTLHNIWTGQRSRDSTARSTCPAQQRRLARGTVAARRREEEGADWCRPEWECPSLDGDWQRIHEGASRIFIA